MSVLRRRDYGGGQEMPPLRHVAGQATTTPSSPANGHMQECDTDFKHKEEEPMGFFQCHFEDVFIRHYADFSGKTSRKQFWWACLCHPGGHAHLELLLPACFCGRRSASCRHIPFPVPHNRSGCSAVVRHNPETPRRRKGLGMDIHQLRPFYRRVLAVSHPMPTGQHKMPKDTI